MMTRRDSKEEEEEELNASRYIVTHRHAPIDRWLDIVCIRASHTQEVVFKQKTFEYILWFHFIPFNPILTLRL